MRPVAKVVPAAALITLAACGDQEPVVDSAGIDLDLPIERMDSTVFHAGAGDPASTIGRIVNTHGTFGRTYLEEVLQLPPVGDSLLPRALAEFLRDPAWQVLQHGIDSALGDLGPQRAGLEEAFERLKAVFPDSLTPRLVAFNSGFNYGVLPTDSVLGIGLEWFIGPDHEVVRMLAPEVFPDFVKRRMVPEMLVPAAVKGWLLVHYTHDLRGNDLLFNLVETGKVMALLDALLPDVADTLKFAFTEPQLMWCHENEFQMWKKIVGEKWIFSKDDEHISRIMNDAPFTNGFPRESPGHVGEWIGYRMIRAYMEDHPDLTFAELFALDDPREILKSYKPH